MEERHQKLRRLSDFKRAMPDVTASALAAILEEVSVAGVPPLHSKKNIAQATALLLNEETPYGPMLIEIDVVAIDGRTVKMQALNPLVVLYTSFLQVGSFTEAMVKKLGETPCTADKPWRLVLYCDEVVAGNALAHDNHRKFWILYFSWLELGPLLLQREQAWFTCIAKRSSEVNKLAAGISQVVAAHLKLFFGGLMSNLAVGGAQLKHPNGSYYRFFCTLGMVLQDGGAHKLVWGAKGDAGTRGAANLKE
jgi:hypothetical protein